MGVPVSKKDGHAAFSQQKREDIIAAAVCEFQRTGFDRTTMNQIAEAADVSKRTIYKHFSGKDELFLAIVQELLQRTESGPELIYCPGQDLAEALGGHASGLIELMTTGSLQMLARVTLSRFLARPELVSQTIGNHRRFQARLTRWIKAAVADGRLQAEDPDWMASVFMGLLKEFAFWPQIISQEPNLSRAKQKKLVQWVVDLFLMRFALDDK